MRPFAVIFHPPTLDLPLRVGQVHEPTRIQALVPKPPVEALYVAILHRLARLDMNHRDALLFAPRQEVPAGELRPVVAAHRFRLAALGNDPLQHARYLLAADPRADLDRRTLPCVAVDDRQRPQSASAGQCIGNEIQRLLLVGPAQDGIGGAIAREPLPLQPPHHQAFLAVEPVDTLHVHLPAAARQNSP